MERKEKLQHKYFSVTFLDLKFYNLSTRHFTSFYIKIHSTLWVCKCTGCLWSVKHVIIIIVLTLLEHFSK